MGSLWRSGAVLCLLAGTVCVSSAGELVAPLDMLKHMPGKTEVHLKRLDAGTVEWRLPTGGGEGITLDLAALGVDATQYDEIRFDLKPVNGQVALSMAMVGHRKPGEISRWYLKFRTPTGEWSEGRYELDLDDDGLTKKVDPKNTAKTLTIKLGARHLGRPGEPRDRIALIRNLRLVKRQVYADMKLMEATTAVTRDEVANLYKLHVTNKTAKPQTVKIDLDSGHTLKYFQVQGPASIQLAAGETQIVPVRLFMPKPLAMSMAALYSEPLYPKVFLEGVPDGDMVPLRGYRRWPLWATVPVFNPVVWTPETFQAYLNGRSAFKDGIAQMKISVVRAADSAMKYDWPIPHFGPPGFDQAYRCPVCKKKKSLQPATPTSLHKHVCRICKKVIENDEQMDRHYVRIYHGRRAADMKNLALAWLFTGKDAYAEKCAKMLLGYAAVYNQMPIIGTRSTYARSRIGGSSLGSSYTTPHFAQAFYYVQKAPCLDAEKRQAIRQLIKQMGVEVAQHSVEYSNQQAEHFNAYGCCGLATGFWPLAAEAVHGDFGWHQITEFGYDEDGIGHEGGAYHWAIFKAMYEFGEFSYAYGLNLFTPRFKRVIDGTLAAGMMRDASCLELPYRTYMDLDYVPRLSDPKHKRGRHMSVAMFGVEGLPDANKLPVESLLMPNAGWIFLRRGSMNHPLEIRMNYIKQFDRHERDRFTTFFYEAGRQKDASVARISYGIKGCWWMNDTAGHNCIVIDGQNAKAVGSQLLAYNPEGDVPVAAVRTDPQTPLYKGVTQTRVIALVENTYVVFDRVVCEKPRLVDRYQWGQGTAQLKFEAKAADPAPENLPKGGQFKDLEGGPCGKELCLEYVRKQPKQDKVLNVLKLRLACTQDMLAYKAKTWGGYEGQPMETTFARVPQTQEVSFLAAFTTSPEQEPAAVTIVKSTDDLMTFEVKPGDKTYTVTLDAKAKKARVAVK